METVPLSIIPWEAGDAVIGFLMAAQWREANLEPVI